MTYSEKDVVAKIAGLSATSLSIYIEEGWINPGQSLGRHTFKEIDIARLQLILELQNDLMVNTEALPIILSLIDQIHGLRHKLRSLADAIETQPNNIQQAILNILKDDKAQDE